MLHLVTEDVSERRAGALVRPIEKVDRVVVEVRAAAFARAAGPAGAAGDHGVPLHVATHGLADAAGAAAVAAAHVATGAPQRAEELPTRGPAACRGRLLTRAGLTHSTAAAALERERRAAALERIGSAAARLAVGLRRVLAAAAAGRIFRAIVPVVALVVAGSDAG